jgi:exodeoxyribonuclease VII small subunit
MSEKSERTITEKTAELNKMVVWFDSDDFELEQAVIKFSEAEKLAEEIEQDLKELKNTIEVVKTRFNGAS